ncbi:MAG: HAMP domain-containing sensor histidine kinase [Desulfuromonas sp.]|nr:HAMP domain-containing sensor histidine kinase [Desulfuromonas sp.]
MKRPFGLRSEIVISSSLLVGAALLFVALLLLRLSETRLIEQSIELHSRNTQALAQMLATYPEQRLAQLLKIYAKTTQLDSWQLSDSSGQVINASSADSLINSPASMLKNRRIQQTLLWQPVLLELNYPPSWTWIIGDNDEPRFIELHTALASTNNQRLVLQLRFSLQEIYTQMLSMQKFALSCCLAYGLVLVLTAVFVLNRSVVRPIVKLTDSTQLISSGDLSQRVEADGSRELVMLAQSFNMMAANLERNTAEQQLQLEKISASNRELQLAQHHLAQAERLASVGNLTSGIAHELGNPLSAVIGYLELLKRKDLPEQLQDLVTRALIESGRMDQLLKDMLDFASSSSEVGHSICDPLAVIQQTCTLLHNQGALKQRQLELELTESLPEVSIAPHKLQQVLVNLIINARDATGENGTITLTARSAENLVEIRVSDNGQGISQEHIADIFDPFFTTKAPGSGRGLGLFVSYQLISGSGGNLSVAPHAPNGSCFTINLPAKGTTSS